MKLLTDYLGHPVRLTDERLKHILEHPGMVDLTHALEETLREPQMVIQSVSDETAVLNYRYYMGTMVGDKWLCVVVAFKGRDAFVLTAYLTDKPKQGEMLWSKE